MIEKTISDKFFGGGLEINPSTSKDIRKLDYDVIGMDDEQRGVDALVDAVHFKILLLYCYCK